MKLSDKLNSFNSLKFTFSNTSISDIPFRFNINFYNFSNLAFSNTSISIPNLYKFNSFNSLNSIFNKSLNLQL